MENVKTEHLLRVSDGTTQPANALAGIDDVSEHDFQMFVKSLESNNDISTLFKRAADETVKERQRTPKNFKMLDALRRFELQDFFLEPLSQKYGHD